ncbi:MAG: hypothetical protein L0387_42775 [Acidobacteria bacterium]|nr:hypothetical protein [Acidobacteriota bacterium]
MENQLFQKETSLLRQEAKPLLWSALNGAQQEAFNKVVSLLAETVKEIDDQNTKPANTGYGDYRRISRIAYLDGERGTGKTTVFLSIYEECKRDDAPPEKFPKFPKQDLEKLRKHAVWLEPLDMDPLPHPTNLLVAILARIESLFKKPDRIPHAERSGYGQRPPGLLECYPDYLDALQELQRVQTDAAIAWDGNLPGRGAHVDPDTYAVEVLRAENARLSLNQRLSETLDKLVTGGIPGRYRSNVLFVLPIDDVDLNPLRCLEIMKLLRTISVPRLFTLVLGDLDGLEIVLNLNHSGELVRLASGEAALSGLLSVEDREIRRLAGTVAANALRKLIPPAQRVKLGLMSVKEALDFQPLRSTGQTISNLLEYCPAILPVIKDDNGLQKIAGKEIKNQRDFLLFDDTNRTNERVYYYSALGFFRMPPRVASDWWHQLFELTRQFQNHADDKKWHALINLLGHHCRSAILEDTSLPRQERREYAEALRVNPVTDVWELSRPIISIPETDAGNRIDGIPADSFPCAVSYCRGKGWQIQPAEAESLSWILDWKPVLGKKELGKELTLLRERPFFSAPTTGGLMLLYDLLALGPEWKLEGSRMRIYWPWEPWATTEWYSPGSRVLLQWPVPRFLSYWAYDIFLGYWNEAIDRSQTGQGKAKQSKQSGGDDAMTTAKEAAENLRYLAFAWIDAGVAFLSRDKPIAAITWDELAERLSKLLTTVSGLPGVNPRREVVEEWLIELACFLMGASYGIGTPISSFDNNSVAVCEFWQTKTGQINQLRAQIYEGFKGPDLEKLATRLTIKDDNIAEKMGLPKLSPPSPPSPPTKRKSMKSG